MAKSETLERRGLLRRHPLISGIAALGVLRAFITWNERLKSYPSPFQGPDNRWYVRLYTSEDPGKEKRSIIRPLSHAVVQELTDHANKV